MAPANGHCATVYTPVKAAKAVFLPLLQAAGKRFVAVHFNIFGPLAHQVFIKRSILELVQSSPVGTVYEDIPPECSAGSPHWSLHMSVVHGPTLMDIYSFGRPPH